MGFFFRGLGGLFATTSTARSKRAHASGSNSMSDDFGDLEDDLAMQPLSRVRPKADVVWGEEGVMSRQPKIAIKIAECISEWVEIETILGLFLGVLIDADAKAALAIYSSLENRKAQFRILKAAAAAKLPQAHFDVFTAVLAASVTPAMRQRDKYAHWCWAYSPQIPDALLLGQPDQKLSLHFAAIHSGDSVGGYKRPRVQMNASKIFVVREPDVDRTLLQLRQAKNWLALLNGSVWSKNDQQERDEFRRQLSSEPQIRAAMDRQPARQKTPKARKPPHRPSPSKK